MIRMISNPSKTPPRGWPELIGSGNPEVGDYGAVFTEEADKLPPRSAYAPSRPNWKSPWIEGLEAADKDPKLVKLRDLTHAYVQATVRGLRYAGLRKLVLRALDMLARMPNPARRKRDADDALGKWMSAALDDPNVCAEMKSDINEWFEAIENAKLAQKVLQQIREAQIVMRAEREKWKQETFLEHYSTGADKFVTETGRITPDAWDKVREAIGIGNHNRSEPVAIHCTKCGKDEPGPECADCEVEHCPIRPLLPKRKRKPHARSHSNAARPHRKK